MNSVIKCDFHMHSDFSSDSTATALSMAEQAVKLGLSSICFTDHNDFDFPPENGEILFNLNLNKYKNAINALRQQFDGRLSIYCGIEQGLTGGAADRINDYDDAGLDMIIGSSHLVYGADPYYTDFWADHSVNECVLKYYESILENVDVCSNYDVYGHIDYIARYIPSGREPYIESDYYDILDAILRAVIAHGKGIEINTAGYAYGMERPNPSSFILKRYHELGGEIITVGSDAHQPDRIAGNFDKIPAILTDAGFKYYTIFKCRKPEFISML